MHAKNRNKDADALRAQIDENLKKVYQQALEEQVPDRFRDLLEQLRQKEAKG
ncbi:MAG: transcriptional regulator [Sphingomonadales bacterium]|nr:transcriptional regulator [Sphingomonadales bacterium]